MNFTFTITSPKHGTFTVTAPERFRNEIERHVWHVQRNRTRRPEDGFDVCTNIRLANGRKTSLRLYRAIWQWSQRPPTPEIDHRDGNPLNNAETNLRAATKAENRRSVRRRKNNTSGAIGVSWNKRASKWLAQIQVDGSRIHLGYFVSIAEAAEVRDRAAVEYFKDFAPLKEISEYER